MGVHGQLSEISRRGSPRHRAVLAIFAMFSACGKSIEQRPEDEPPEGSDFWRRQAIVACEVDLACGHINLNSARRCRLNAVSGPTPTLDAALREGTVEYAPENAAACFQTMRDTCLTQHIGACQHVFIGNIPEGEPCSLHEECENNGLCTGQDEAGTNPTCAPGVERGRSCGLIVPCPAAPGEVGVCEDLGEGFRCYVAPAPELAGAGEPCGVTEPNDEWEIQLTPCEPYLRCDGGVCTTLLDPGATCEFEMDCGPDATCAWDACAPIVVRDYAGDTCGFDRTQEPPVYEDCNADYLACSDGTCQLIGDGSEGAVCDILGRAHCNDGLQCDYSSNRCLRDP
jgi:hypothetical protein